MPKEENKFKKWVKKLEKKYNTKIICLFGDIDDFMYNMFVRQLRNIDKNIESGLSITIVFHTLGGDADIAIKISDVIRNHKCKFISVVPIVANSAGTHIAIGTDKVILGKYAYLTAFDSMMGNIALNNMIDFDLDRCTNVKDYNKIKEALKEKKIARDELDKMFLLRYSERTIDKVNCLMLEHDHCHDYPLSYKMIKSTGITHIHQENLSKLYHKMVDKYYDCVGSNNFFYKDSILH